MDIILILLKNQKDHKYQQLLVYIISDLLMVIDDYCLANDEEIVSVHMIKLIKTMYMYSTFNTYLW